VVLIEGDRVVVFGLDGRTVINHRI
jgi:hypothetical protein